MATVKPASGFDAEEAAKEIQGAMKGMGTDEETVVNVVSRHCNEQRQEIKDNYKSCFGDDLEDDIKSELKKELQDLCIALLTPPTLYDANELRAAMKGVGTEEDILIEIMCTRENDDIENIKQVYEEVLERNLEEDFENETGGHFTKILVSQCNAGRDEGKSVDRDLAREEAQAIYDAGEGSWGTDESVMQSILCTRNYEQLKETFDEYYNIAGQDIEEAIKSECAGTVQDGYLAIVKRSKDINAFFAERLNNALEGMGTADETLIRIVTSRSEIDLSYIKDAYESKYEKSLYEAINDDANGDYKDLLLAIVKE